MSTWHEIARLPNSSEKGLDCTAATYSIHDDGKVEAVNRGRKASKGDKYSEAKGKACLPNPGNQGQLKVRFIWPFTGDYDKHHSQLIYN